MTVSLTFSTVSGTSGPPIYLPQSAGTLAPNTSSSILTLYVRHNGTNAITDLKYYMIPYAAGVYRGTATAQEDFDQLIDWGDIAPAGTYGVKFTDNSSVLTTIKTGTGDSLANAVTEGTGTIAHDGVDTIKIQIVTPPITEASLGDGGTKYFDLMFTYTYTS